jgi:hypothetical protein
MEEAESTNRRGYTFEESVYAEIRRLEEIGFARDIRRQERVRDRNGNYRKVDVSFILVTWAVEILVSIECKSKGRSISLDDVDQLMTFKRELPERNIFWLVYEGSVNSSVRRALKSNGISAYSGKELFRIIKSLVQAYANSGIEFLRQNTAMLSDLDPIAYGESAAALKSVELRVLEPLSEVSTVLRTFGYYVSNPYKRAGGSRRKRDVCDDI